MKKRTGLIIGVATGLLLAVSFGGANADHDHTRRYKGRLAGTFLGTRIDLNDDGVPATWSTQEVSGTLGKRTNQLVTESVHTGPTSDCPGGVSIVDAQHGLGFGTGTGTFPKGDQLYFQLLTRTQCGLGGGKSTVSDTWTIVGGTGKFDGASGTYEQHVTVICQAFDPNANPPQCFGSVSGEFDGTLTLP
ncbi:MAG TPA: hypothetical protein VGX03_07700 [Candidatus Binatia bacterium]|jgi:hypothetical protein|nr:hypothetical protein [Candidatus Binatia bacterium]